MEGAKLHITIGSTPQLVTKGKSKVMSFENDLEMVKATLLYADQVTLFSLASSLLLEMIALRNTTGKKQMEALNFIADCIPDSKDGQMIKGVIEFARHPSQKHRRHELSALISHSWHIVKNNINSLALGFGGDGILDAMDSGLLRVHSFDSSIYRTLKESENEKFLEEFIQVVGGTVSNGESYPLFDELLSGVIRTGILAGVFPVKDSMVIRGKETGLAADLLSRLPLFPGANIKEILEIRTELQPYLKRFRSAMIRFSDGIKNASWDEDFSFDADQVFRRDIEPAIENIEAEVKANRFLAELARKLTDKSSLLSGGGSALVLSMSNLSLPTIASLAIGAAIGFSTAYYDTSKEWNKKQRELEQNNLFFYYKAGTILTKRIV